MNRVFCIDVSDMSSKELKEIYEHTLEWVKHDDGWIATYRKGNTVLKLLHTISEQEYFKLRLTGKDGSTLVKLYDEWCKSDKIGLYRT
jgi:hypothetical protein